MKLMQPDSADIRPGNQGVWYENRSGIIDPGNQDSVSSPVQEVMRTRPSSTPGQCVPAACWNTSNIPTNIVSPIEAHRALPASEVPGTRWGAGSMPDSGAVTLEMANVNPRPVKVSTRADRSAGLLPSLTGRNPGCG
jgi:hypothetical protein